MFISYSVDELNVLKHEDFGDWGVMSVDRRGEKRGRKRDVYFKPHPDTVTSDMKIFKDIAGSGNESPEQILDQYRAGFNTTSHLEDNELVMLRMMHPHKHLMGTILTQQTDSESD